jgi:hypothetical protein
VPLEVLVEQPQPRGDLREGDPETLHGASIRPTPSGRD